MKPTLVPPTVLVSSVDGEDREIPEYATSGSAGLDLRCVDPFTVAPNGGVTLVRTGLAFAIPEGYEAQIRPRSGLALKYGLTVLNSPGTIDSDYRGEVSVMLINHGSGPFNGQAGDRIAQMVIAPVVQPTLQPVADMQELGDTERGQGGFGSTGVSDSSPAERH